MDRKFLRSYFFLNKIIFTAILVFVTFSLTCTHARATICSEGNLWNNGTNECSDKIITGTNLEETDIKQKVLEEKQRIVDDVNEEIILWKNGLDAKVGDINKNSKEVVYVKKILDDSLIEMGKNYDTLITTLAKMNDHTFWLHDDIGENSKLTALIFIKVKLQDFSSHLENGVGATTSEELKEGLQNFLSDLNAINSIGNLFATREEMDVNGNSLHKIDIELQENGSLDMGLLPPRFNLGGQKFKFTYSIAKDTFDTNNSVIMPATPVATTFSYELSKCPKGVPFMSFNGSDSIVNTQSCSIVAYLINMLVDGINQMLNIFVSWAGVLFDWIMEIGVYGFSDWVTNSGAYDIWRKIILALVTSLLLPLIFYLIIRMLIDNDTSNIEKVLPKILFTALFVYFSFTIVGWIIDQSNILTIYTYRSMTGGGTQPISDILEKVLAPTTSALDNLSMGDWSSTPLYLLQVIISSVSLMVIFQGAILIFARTVTLLLAMIFSPLMLMPVGIHSLIDKYRDMVIKYFSNGVLLGPIFMFLLLLGIQVGDVAGNIVGTNSADVLNSAAGAGSGVLSAAITSVLVIIVLQLAITVAKNLSGELGTLLSQKVSAFTGGLALGGTGSALRNTVGRFAMKAQEKGWMKGKEGSARHKMMTKLYGNLGKSTFDVRGTKAFKAAAGTSLGKNIGLGDLGKSSTSTAKTRFDRKLASEAAYHNTLSDDGKDRNIKRLKNPLLSVFGTRYRTDIANKLDKKNKRKQNTNTATTNSGVVGATQNTSQNSNLAGSSTVGANSAVGQNSTQVSPPSPSTIAPNSIPNSQSDRNIGASPEGPSGPGKDSSSRYSDSPSPVRQEENSIPPMPSSKSLSQHRLKERLREKYGTHERMEDGKIVRRFDQQLLDNRRRDLKTTQRNIEREEENKYQDNVLREAKERDKKTNLLNSDTSSTSSSSTVDSQSIQINYPNNGAKIIDIDDKKANNIDEDNIRA